MQLLEVSPWRGPPAIAACGEAGEVKRELEWTVWGVGLQEGPLNTLAPFYHWPDSQARAQPGRVWWQESHYHPHPPTPAQDAFTLK